ncbi:MAG TPA: hypothetical protein PLQ90_04240 [Sphaerochaeta sp.]|nr:hypothetical protein [Sphaerochaeta sp.]
MRKKSLLVIVLSLELVLLRGMNWGFHLAIVLGGGGTLSLFRKKGDGHR